MEYLLGVMVIVIGIPLSIGWHELGHLLPAKLFGVKCPQYMIGFGATLWSRKVGETEYGVKAVPFGGYVRMIGMYPPKPPSRDGIVRRGRWASLIEQARDDARAEVGPDDGDRQFYQRPVCQRIIIMLGGPTMNLILATVIIGGIAVGYGIAQQTTTIRSVSRCVLPADASENATCSATDRPAPAAAAGVLPGDRLLTFAGQRVSSWDQTRRLIRDNGDRTVDLTVERGGKELRLTMTPVSAQRPVLGPDGGPVKGDNGAWVTEKVGFAGLTAASAVVKQPVTAVPGIIWGQVSGTLDVVLDVPAKMVGVTKAVFGLEKRDPNGLVSIIGVGRMAGEVASGSALAKDSTVTDRTVGVLALLGGLNLALFVFNLIPLLPLDGGHVAGALWEALRRTANRLLRRPDPGPVDTVRALPLIYAVASVLVVMGGLLMYADLVSPVRLGG